MDKFYVITNSEKDQDQSFTDMIVSYSEKSWTGLSGADGKTEAGWALIIILIRRRSLRIPSV